MNDLDWEQAACRGIPPEVFFPEPGNRPSKVADALAICRQCPVRVACARDAVRIGARHGVFAGIDLGDSPTSPQAPAGARRLRALAEGSA